jgi:hypothetical protein
LPKKRFIESPLFKKSCTFLRRATMNLDDFIITCFCTIDEMPPTVTKGKRLRERGPMPKLAESEVVTIEVVGTYLGLQSRSGSV